MKTFRPIRQLAMAGLLCSASIGSEPQKTASIVDYYKSTGRDPSFAQREADFQKLYPNEKFNGSASQNEKQLRAIRFIDVLESQAAEPRSTKHPPLQMLTESQLKRTSQQLATSPKLASANGNSSIEAGLLARPASGVSRVKDSLKIMKEATDALPNALSGDPIRSFSEPINDVREKARLFNRELVDSKKKSLNDWLAASPTAGTLSPEAAQESERWLAEKAEHVHQMGTACRASCEAVKKLQVWDKLDRRRKFSTLSLLDDEAKRETVTELEKCSKLAAEVEPNIREAAEAQRTINRNFWRVAPEPSDTSEQKEDVSRKERSWWK